MIYEGLRPEEVAERTRDERSRIRNRSFDAETSSGIRLGMTEHTVRRVLGEPRRALWSKRFRAEELIYSRETPKDREGVSIRLSNYYLFRGGKLYYIGLARDTIGGA
jgi:hypothetical protein